MGDVNAPSPSVFGPLRDLPRGPHGLARDEVAAAQRTRLLAAAAQLLGERGLAGVTITAVVKRAHVSPNQFYVHFASRDECLLAGYDLYVAELIDLISAALAADADPQTRIGAAIGAYLSGLERDRATARAFLIEFDAVGEVARAKRREGVAAFAAIFEREHSRMREQDPSLGGLPPNAYGAVVNAIRAQACDALESSYEGPLTHLGPDIMRWVTALVRGAE